MRGYYHIDSERNPCGRGRDRARGETRIDPAGYHYSKELHCPVCHPGDALFCCGKRSADVLLGRVANHIVTGRAPVQNRSVNHRLIRGDLKERNADPRQKRKLQRTHCPAWNTF